MKILPVLSMKRSRPKLVLAVALALGASHAQFANAADKYMDAGLGGAVWDSSTFDWGTSPSGPYDTAAWGDYDYAHFTGTGGTVTLDSTQKANYVYFDSDGYTISGTGMINLGNPLPQESINVGSGYTATINTNIGVVNNQGLSLNSASGYTGTLVINGQIQNAGGGVNIGGGTVILTGANNYTGTTTISAGSTVQVGNGGSGGSIGYFGGAVVNNGNLLYNMNSSGSAGLGSVTGSGGLSATIGSIDFTGNVTLGGSLNVTQVGSGTLYTGIQVGYTTPNLALTASSITLFGDVGHYNYNGNNMALDTSATNGSINLNISLGRPNVWYNLSSFTANAGTGVINVTGTGPDSSGWNGTPVTLTGAVNISGNVKSASSVTINSTAAGSISGVLSGVMPLTKTGSGTLTLTAANTYTGATTVNAGTLLVNGPSGSLDAGSAVTVVLDAIFGGTGTVNGATTVNGTILGGAGADATGTFTLGGNLTLNSGSTIRLALGALGAHSSLALNGATDTFATNQTFNFLDFGAALGTYSSLITGLTVDPGVSGWTISNPGWSGTFSYNAGAIDLNITAVPEPGAWMSLLGGCGVLLGLRRRRIA